MNIDESLEKLQDIATRLEQKDIPLDRAIALFEEGLSLAATIKEALEQAKLRMETVVEKTKGTFSLDAFDLS